MALSNRDRINKMFELMAPALDDFIAQAVGAQDPALGAVWSDLVRAKDAAKGIPVESRTYDPLDPQLQFRILTENSITTHHAAGWYPFSDPLGPSGKAYVSELRDVRNTWAHNGAFSDDDAYRALDTAERLLKHIGAGSVAFEVAEIRLNLRRVSADKADKRVTRKNHNPSSDGLRPWRDVVQPHDDVATGNFQASEFAADLFKVSRGEETNSDYADPISFFRRTYLTEGLRDLIGRSVKRLSGDDNASPVINLQTNFGGGKTHSMLALWHLAAGRPLDDFPQETQELLASNGYTGEQINRVAIVGNQFATTGEEKPDGTYVNTIWGELAWQLGGAEGYAMVAKADKDSTPPGAALHDLLKAHAPAVILIDEWVAYARTLVLKDDSPAGTFDDQFTFAQALTEAAKGTKGVLLAISIPASERGVDGNMPEGNTEEVGGTHGVEALKRLQNVVRRVADQWRPASSREAYHIVKQRLFKEPDAATLADIANTARTFSEFYRKHSADFPKDSRETTYEQRIRETYPIHPELFDTLYEQWSTLERFQRTRGVLRLMSTVVHALWVSNDTSPMILPGSIPLTDGDVNSELTQYLQDNWKTIIDADVDGDNSEPVRIDTDKPVLGQRALTRRLARTVFFGAAPTIAPGATTKGIETQRVFLGTAVPGDVPGNFHTALTQLSDRATYYYSGSGKHWYDVQANISRTAKDQAERLHREDVWAEIVRRLQGQSRTTGDFAGVHVGPEGHSDIPDTDSARLVVLHPKYVHKAKASSSTALDFARNATEKRGSSNRFHRNMLVFLAADQNRLEELDNAVRDYLGWSHVIGHAADLDLTQNQHKQATQRQQKADETVQLRLLQTFAWALMPERPTPDKPFVLREVKVDGNLPSLAERVSKKLINDGSLATAQAAANVRHAISKVPSIWQNGHISFGDLWNLYTQYSYMPRLRDRDVLARGIFTQPMIWQTDGFAYATGYDEGSQRYTGLWLPSDTTAAPAATDSLLLVRPDVAEPQRAEEKAAHDKEEPSGDNADATQRDRKRPADSNDDTKPDLRADVFHRFFGSKELDGQRIAIDFKTIAEEVLAHLRDEGTELTVRIEVEASRPDGFSTSQVRTVKENASVLKFDQAGFEKE